MEVVALEDAGHRELARQAEHLLEVERQQPFGVVHKRGLVGVEHLECLVDVRLGIMLDLLVRKLRARGIATRRIADERRAVADDKRDLMPQILELAQLAQWHGMADVDIGSRGIDAKFDVERRAALQLLKQRAFGNDAIDTACNDV